MPTSAIKPSFSQLIRHPVCFLGLGFGSGLVPKAPGTFGTLAAVPIYLWLCDLPLWSYTAVVILAMIAGITICQQSARWLGQSDPAPVVWDEIVGYLITMLAAPSGWVWLVIGFVLFRFFDIVKPWPVNWCDRRLSGGLGIMADDVVAGVMAAFVLQSLAFFLIS